MRINTLLIFLCIITTLGVSYLDIKPEMVAYSYNNLTVNHAWWTLVTSLFMHGGLLHLGGNVLFMILFGYPLDKFIGKFKFALSFLLGGVSCFLICNFFYPPYELMVGASGAICTFIAMLMLYNPWKLSLLLVGFPMPLGVAGLSYILFNYFMAMQPVDASKTSMHTAYYAHIIGFVMGILFSIFWNPDWKKNLLVCILMFVLYYAVLLYIINHFIGQ